MTLKMKTHDSIPHRIPVPLLLNLVLVVIGIAAVILFSRTYRTRLDIISSQENRFVTMEWELLQELKRQTDMQLLQKDREIADLRRQYRILVEQNASEQTLKELELLITIAGSERETIASREPLQDTVSSESSLTAIPSLLASHNGLITDPVQLTTLMAARIETLTAQLAERQVYARTLQEQLVSSGLTPETLIPGEEKEWQEKERQIETYTTLLAASANTLDSIVNTITQSLSDEQNRLRAPLQNLEAWVLLRAIATSPAIRSEYPDLANSMTRYLESFAEKERAAGRAEAYRLALDTLKPLDTMLEN